MIEPTRQDIGRTVFYRQPCAETGIVTSFNDNVVFVRYGNEPSSKATYPRDLHWIEPPPAPDYPAFHRGIRNALILALPFWIAVALIVWWVW